MLTKEEKEELFQKNIHLVHYVWKRKFSRQANLKEHREDIIQEGFIALWNFIDKKECIKKGEFDGKWAYSYVWSAMGNFIARKVFVDKRLKIFKEIDDLEFVSIDYEINGEGTTYKLESILNIECEALEDKVIAKVESERMIEFWCNVDKYCFGGKRKYREIIKLKLDGLSNSEIAQRIGGSATTVGNKTREMKSLYIEAYA